MADDLHAGIDVPAAGTYRCATCGFELFQAGTKPAPPCPSCSTGRWLLVARAGDVPTTGDTAATGGTTAGEGGTGEPDPT